MRTLLSGASAAIAIFAGGAAEAQEPGRKFLSHEELKTLLSRTRTVRFAGLATGTGIFAADGTASVYWIGGSDLGGWRIDGDQFCSRYAQVHRGVETCYRLQRTGENAFTLYWNDTVSGTWQVEP